MNGTAAKLLRNELTLTTKGGKRWWNSLNHIERRKVRQAMKSKNTQLRNATRDEILDVVRENFTSARYK